MVVVRGGEPERVGCTSAFGFALLNLLSLAGWQVAVTGAFAGGVLVIASKGAIEVRRQGDTVAEIASEVFAECLRITHPGRFAELEELARQDEQLRLAEPPAAPAGCGNCGRPLGEHCQAHQVPCCPGRCRAAA